MKNPVLFLLFLVAAHQGSAQCNLTQNKVDPFTGAKVVTTKLAKAKAKSALSSNYLITASLIVTQGDGNTYLSIGSIPGPSSSCVSSTSKAIFLWEDGKTETYQHVNKVECRNPFHMVVVPSDSRLWTETPKAVRLYYTDGYVDVDILGDDIMQHLNCTK